VADAAVALSCLVLVIGALWLFTHVWLRGPSLRRFDQPGATSVRTTEEPPSGALAEVLELLGGIGAAQHGQPWRARLAMLRERLDALGDATALDGIEILPAQAGGVPAEWVLALGADPHRRLLYLHGGAFAMGSPRSHRALTTALSRLTGASVLAIDYRLIPEHRRLDALADCQASYRWILDNGPAGPAPLSALFVAGDSAGGNLTLATIAWARDAGLRAADAAVALSPATDATLSAPSILANLESDHMLGPQFGFIARLPSALVLWIAWLTARVRPCDPRVSPAHGDLAGLPPTLVHASETEMLVDDARRYVNKARAAGSPATLETWPHMVHVWHIFHPRLPEGRESLERIANFLEQQAPRTRSA
jgi:acetyl esterase/lipase